jgi:hypothetical protein
MRPNLLIHRNGTTLSFVSPVTWEPERDLRIRLWWYQHDLSESRWGRREPGERAYITNELSGARDDRASDQRGDEPLDERPEREPDRQ